MLEYLKLLKVVDVFKQSSLAYNALLWCNALHTLCLVYFVMSYVYLCIYYSFLRCRCRRYCLTSASDNSSSSINNNYSKTDDNARGVSTNYTDSMKIFTLFFSFSPKSPKSFKINWLITLLYRAILRNFASTMFFY